MKPTILTTSMLDAAMGEGARRVSDMTPEDLATLREFNEVNHVEAPRIEDICSPETAGFIKQKMQDFSILPPGKVIPVDSPEEGAAIQDFAGKIDGGGIKMSMFTDFITKPPMELVPKELSLACARALGYGAAKYAPNNWRRGMRWGEVFGALKRHLDAWNEGEDLDAEEDGGSGLNHLDHAAACLSFLCHMVANEGYKKLDDRP